MHMNVHATEQNTTRKEMLFLIRQRNRKNNASKMKRIMPKEKSVPVYISKESERIFLNV